MRYFSHLDPLATAELFHRAPQEFDGLDSPDVLATALGATLYIPATRPDLTAAVHRQASLGVRSVVLDLEDAIADHHVQSALAQVCLTLTELATATPPPTLVFIRIRDTAAIRLITAATTDLGALSGFVIPKFTAEHGRHFLDTIATAGERVGKPLFAMPVLESARLIHRDTRDEELAALAALFADYRRHVLAVRIGATDMCGQFAIRRDPGTTIYDVRVVADVIADVVNHLGRAESGFVITGPVWEYYTDCDHIGCPTPLSTLNTRLSDNRLSGCRPASHALTDLLRETTLDRANGIHGKTVIHPSHVTPVNAFNIVTHEQFHDALDVLGGTQGAHASSYRNKMNEAKPHHYWARRILLRAQLFGVTHRAMAFHDVLTALTAEAR